MVVIFQYEDIALPNLQLKFIHSIQRVEYQGRKYKF